MLMSNVLEFKHRVNEEEIDMVKAAFMLDLRTCNEANSHLFPLLPGIVRQA